MGLPPAASVVAADIAALGLASSSAEAASSSRRLNSIGCSPTGFRFVPHFAANLPRAVRKPPNRGWKLRESMAARKRCAWASSLDAEYTRYHDEEWGATGS